MTRIAGEAMARLCLKAAKGTLTPLLALALLGCATPAPNPLDRPGDMPAAFTAPRADANAPAWPAADWWKSFRAAELPPLMDAASADNLDIAQAAARVRQAEASARLAFAGMLPQAEAGLGASRRGSRAFSVNSFSATFSASYVVDYLGENRNLYRVAQENLRAYRYDAAVVELAAQAAVAETYFNILALREQITITRRNIEAARRLLVIAQAKFDEGASSYRDVAQEQVVVSREEARLPLLAEQERQARYTLAILLGRPPEGFDIKGQNLDGLASPNVKGGLPSEILARRPDIARAEASMLAAHANLDAARAAYFPRISLTGSAGWGSAALDMLINPASFVWTIGAKATQAIFAGGSITAENDRARAQQDELVAAYRQAVFTAFQDVESAIGNVHSANARLEATLGEARAAAEGYRVSELQYREGTLDITGLLSSQQQLFSAQTSLVDARLQRLLGNVRLYIALGGGWQQPDSDAAYQPPANWSPL